MGVTFSYGNVFTPGQWQGLFASKQDALGYTPVNRAGDTMQGLLTTFASTSAGAGFSIPPGTAPDQPVDGNVWMTTVGLFARVSGATIGPIANGNIVGPATSVVGDIAIFSTTGGTGLADSGISLGSQSNNLILATPGFGAGAPAFRALVGADLPAPQSVTLGGVRSAGAPPHQFGTGVDTSGNPTFGQPAIGDISGLAANMSAFLAGGTSAQLAAAVSDETGTGSLVFAINPTVSLSATSTGVTQTPGDNSTKFATTAYVQAAIFATTTLPASNYATTAALPSCTYANGASGVGATLTATANGALSVDGVAVALNNVILVKNQASTFQNGIYTVTATGGAGAPFVLTRATWYNLSADIDLGDQTFVVSGATFGTTTWAQNGTENPVIGTDPITFAQTAGLGTYTAGNGLSLVGTQFSISTAVTVDLTTAQSLSNKTLASPTITGSETVAPSGIQAIGVSGNPAANSSAVLVNAPNNAGAAAFLSLNRTGSYAVNFGLDTDNNLKVGGWSMGANAYKIMHEGLASGTFTGSYTFSGTVNITGAIQKSGVAFPVTQIYESAQQTITAAGALTLAHGLGVKPKLYLVVLQCTTAELGYSIGDEMLLNPSLSVAGGSLGQGVSIVPDATNLNVRIGNNSTIFNLLRKDTGAIATITNANWKLVFRAWA